MTMVKRTKQLDRDASLRERLLAAGAEIRASTNPYEVLRFRTKYGVGVIYENAKGARSWTAEATLAVRHLTDNKGSLAPVKTVGRKSSGAGVRQAIIERDGEGCFFCDLVMGDDQTIEHLVSIAHGGPNHICNKFLAHAACNQRAGHLSAPEKIRLRDEMRAKPRCEAAA